jgi:hypothetical protein
MGPRGTREHILFAALVATRQDAAIRLLLKYSGARGDAPGSGP